MRDNRELRLAIEKLAGTHLKDVVSIIICTVDSVDKDELTCDCTPISSDAVTSLPGVLLMAENDDGLVVFPAINSTVVVALSTRNLAYVWMFSEVQEIDITFSNGEGQSPTKFNLKAGLQQFNDGEFGGLTKVIELTEKLNTVENDLNTLKAAFNAWVVVPNDGGAALKGTTSVWAGENITPTIRADIENTLVKHGE